MNHDSAAKLLNDYLEGELATPQTEELERHVRQCLACRRELDGLRQLLEGTAALPRSIEPVRDLWPAIAEQIVPMERVTESLGSRLLQRLGFFSWSWPTALATGAVVGVLLVSSFNTAPRIGPERIAQANGSLVAEAADPEAAALVRILESECLESDRELAAYTKQDSDSSNTVTRMLEENMPVVNRAITEARTAWLASPDEPSLARLLTSAYRAKMALQGRAIRLASES